VPKEATVETSCQAYIQSWKRGAKATPSTRRQQEHAARSTRRRTKTAAELAALAAGSWVKEPDSTQADDERHGSPKHVDIAGHEGYITVGLFENASRGEISW